MPASQSAPDIHLYHDDLPDGLDLGDVVAIDTETMGLNPLRDRLCLVQLSSGDGTAHLVKIAKDQKPAPAGGVAGRSISGKAISFCAV